MQMVHHHIKYKELHGVDEVILISKSEHWKIHNRLRKEGRCKVPVVELQMISNEAYFRRRFAGGIITRKEAVAWRKFIGFERINFGKPYRKEIEYVF